MAPLNPKSLENLQPRNPDYPGQTKRIRNPTVTDAGWEGAKSAAAALGIVSISALLEMIGRGEVLLTLADVDLHGVE